MYCVYNCQLYLCVCQVGPAEESSHLKYLDENQFLACYIFLSTDTKSTEGNDVTLGICCCGHLCKSAVIINPRRACSARVTVLVCLSVCLSGGCLSVCLLYSRISRNYAANKRYDRATSASHGQRFVLES